MKKKIKTVKNNKKKVNKRRTRKGGFWPFTTFREQTNPVTKEHQQKNCPDYEKKCEIFDTQLTNTKNVANKINPTWKTCIYGFRGNKYEINYHIFYITPQNVVIKSIDSIQIPEFTVNGSKHKIIIEDKYISCFVFVCGEWYAIMRLFGTTINTELLARTEKNKAFYKLPTEIIIDYLKKKPSPIENTIITIPNNVYTFVENKETIKTIKINDHLVKNINKTTDLIAFGVLQEFFEQKILADSVKETVVEESVFSFLNWL
jgi:hypothetical protein